MNFELINDSNHDLDGLIELVHDFFPFAQKKIGFNRPPTIMFGSDEENAKDLLGKTGHYNPMNLKIMLYVDERHPKDILRSLAHELVHHAQNLRGEFEEPFSTDPGYAQENDHLRSMEKEAYELGNMCFRDWEDLRKKKLEETIYKYNDGRSQNMSLKEWKDNTMNQMLMKKFGLLKEDINAVTNWNVGPQSEDRTNKYDQLEEDDTDEDADQNPEAVPHSVESRTANTQLKEKSPSFDLRKTIQEAIDELEEGAVRVREQSIHPYGDTAGQIADTAYSGHAEGSRSYEGPEAEIEAVNQYELAAAEVGGGDIAAGHKELSGQTAQTKEPGYDPVTLEPEPRLPRYGSGASKTAYGKKITSMNPSNKRDLYEQNLRNIIRETIKNYLT